MAGDLTEVALGAIGTLGPKALAATPEVTAALGHKNKAIRQQAAAAAGNLGTASEALLAALVAAAGEKDEHVASEALGALSRLDAIEALQKLATAGPVATRALAVSAVGSAQQWSAKRLALLLHAANDADWQVRLSAVAAFHGRREAAIKTAQAMLKRAVADSNDAVRDQAAAVVGSSGMAGAADKGRKAAREPR